MARPEFPVAAVPPSSCSEASFCGFVARLLSQGNPGPEKGRKELPKCQHFKLIACEHFTQQHRWLVFFEGTHFNGVVQEQTPWGGSDSSDLIFRGSFHVDFFQLFNGVGLWLIPLVS